MFSPTWKRLTWASVVRLSDLPLVRSRAGVRMLSAAFRRLERAIPVRDDVRAVFDRVQPDVLFVTPLLYFGSKQVDYRKYGFERLVPAGLHNGSPYVFRNYQDDTSFDITVCHLDVAMHEQAFASAGLTGVHWVRPEVSPAGRANFGAQYWETFLLYPPIVLIECHVRA